MNLLNIFLFCVFLYLCTLVNCKTNTHLPVCVLGAGSSGMSSAVFLKDNGYQVKVLEKTGAIGGHCNTLRFGPGLWYDLGVITYDNTSKLTELEIGEWQIQTDVFARRFVPDDSYLIPSDPTFGGLPSFAARFADGVDYGELPAPSPPTPDYLAALGRLVAIVESYPWLENSTYPDVLPPELLVPFDQFIETNELQLLVPTIFNYFMLNGGLANLSNVLAIHALQTSNLFVLSLYQVPGVGFSIKNGCLTIYEGMQQYIGAENIELNAEITSIQRYADYVVVYYSQNNRNYVEKCSNIIVSFTPNLENLAPIQDLSLEELYLFAGMQWHVYVVFNISMSPSSPLGPIACNVFNLNFSNVNPLDATYPNLPAVTFFMKPYSSVNTSFGNTAHGYYYADAYPTCDDDFLIPIRQQLSSIPESLMKDINLGVYYYHQFQPHFRNELYYKPTSPYVLLREMQGLYNTFWVGALSGFASSAPIWNDNFVLINKFFPNLNHKDSVDQVTESAPMWNFNYTLFNQNFPSLNRK